MKTFINELVEHIKFGQGFIISEEDGKIAVKFDAQDDNKTFKFPDAFEHFLKFQDEALQAESYILVQDKKKQIAEENERIRLERENIRLEQEKEDKLRKEKLVRTKKIKATVKDAEPKVIRQKVKKTNKEFEDAILIE